MKQCALYHRASTNDQDPTLAREELHRAASVRGLAVGLDIEETGSGARNDRPGLQRVMDAARRGQISAVLVHKLDRFGRSALDLLSNIRELEARGVEFICTSQGIHIRGDADPMSRLILTTLAGVAEFERSLIKERTKLGLARARAKGKRLGRPGRPKPRRADVERLRSQGATWADIAQALGCSPTSARRAYAGA